MGKMERKFFRRQKKDAGRELQEKVLMFDQLPDECDVCLKPFDKTNKEMVQSWYVTVREKKKTVHLYCPECWENAEKVVKEYEERQRNRDGEAVEVEEVVEEKS